MQAAANRLPRAVERVRPDKMELNPRADAADGIALLDALPIAAAIFTINDDKLWVEAMNRRFLELAGCHGKPETFVETFRRYAAGEGGAVTRNFLLDPAKAPDEIQICEGEGVGRRFLRLKLSPLASTPGGAPRCL